MATSSRVPGCALLSTTSTSSTRPVAKKPSITAADRVALGVGHEHDGDALVVPHSSSPRRPGAAADCNAAVGAGAGRLRFMTNDSRRDDRLRHLHHQARRLRALRGAAASRSAAEPDSDVFACPSIGLDLRELQRAARRGRGARRPRGARARPPGRRDRRRRLLRKVRRRAAPTPTSASSAASAPSACAASPGGRARSPSPRSSTATRSTAAATCRRSPGTGTTRRPTRASARSTRSTGSCSCSRRGWCRTSASTSRWAAFHGYDFDFCLQVREAGRKVVTADFRAIHHHPLELFSDRDDWIEAHVQVAEKWDGRMPGVGYGRGHLARAARLRAEAETREVAHRARPATRGASSTELAGPRRLRRHGARGWRPTTPRRACRSRASPPRPRAGCRQRLAGVIAFGCAITDAEAVPRATPGPGSRLAAEPDSAVHAFAAVGSIGRSYNLLLDARVAPTRISRRSCWCTRTSRSPTPTSAPRSGGAFADPDVAVAGCVGATGVRTHRLVGGVGQRSGIDAALPGARRRRAARVRLGAARHRRRARSTWSTASCSCCRRGRCGTSASTRRWCWATASTSTSACSVALRGPQGRHRRPARDPPQRLELDRRRGAVGGGAHPGGREVGGPDARREPEEDDWQARARRAEAEREAARTLAYSNRLAARRPAASSRRELDEVTGQPLRGSSRRRCAGPTASRQGGAPAGASRRARGGPGRRDTSELGGDPGAHAQPREPLGQRERARVEQPPQHGLLAGRGRSQLGDLGRGRRPSPGGRRGWPRGARAAGGGRRGRGWPGDAVGPRRARCATGRPKPKKAGTTTSAQRRRGRPRSPRRR